MAETIYLRGEGGVVRPIDLPLPEGIADRLTKGYLKRVNADGSEWLPEDESVEPAPPAVNAPKAAWVGWAVHQGMTPDDAEAMTKHELTEKYGRNAE